ncbi:MAG: AAA family ATPase [Bacteroidia bacterium]
MKKQLPSSHQNFERIITDNFLYVDKTQPCYDLLQNRNMLFFARPRRFGKSIMISTMKAIYQGKKHLFEGLWIYDKVDWETIKRPVIHLDFTLLSQNKTAERLEYSLGHWLEKAAKEYGFELTERFAKDKFIELLALFEAQGKKAVLLVDEYDMPLTDALESPTYQEIRETLGDFYGALKGHDDLVHQAIITGVSKFGRVSIFSKLNNLTDISMDEEYMKMCGFTQEEVESYFGENAGEIAKKLKITEKFLWKKIKEEYNGYSWNGVDKLYCPFLIVRFFTHKEFGNYWFDTGTPTILLKILRREGVLPFELEEVESNEGLLSNMDAESIDTVSLLFQTGYLTVKKAVRKMGHRAYFLSYPNNEVRRAFERNILANYLGAKDATIDRNYISKLRNALYNNDIDRFIKICQSLFSSIAYQQIANNDEDAFHAIMHLLVKLTGERVVSEVPHNVGRADNFIFLEERTFILEYKYDGTAAAALKQIIDKNYAQPFEHEGLPFTFIGINFSSEKRNIDDWLPKNDMS